ncbi:MAG: cysteine desulfurase / selenocysteine lyase [Candidatus Sumerlaeota bacterium]|nr:cysteine desulfurase / selenocysteine lyase [Candidatus Sumerlaeota bacterium]
MTSTEPHHATILEPLDVQRVREDFPALHQQVNGHPLVYLDNAATAQKPRAVLDALQHYYENDNANVHRGVHMLSQRATDAYEAAREAVRAFLNVESEKEIVFVRGATEGINLVAQSFGRAFLRAGDEIVISHMEHHSNIVPWQLLCEAIGAKLRVIPINDRGELVLDDFDALLNERTRFVSILHTSNALGTVNPVEDIVRRVRAHNPEIRVLIDGCQAVQHTSVDVRALDCDFFVFSGHKLFGPTGIGVLYGRRELLEAMPPYQGGGDMIDRVSFDGSTWADLPNKFEAGTPHIAGAIGLGAAIDYVRALGIERIEARERELLAHGTAALESIPGLRLIGTAAHKTGVLSFIVDGIHPHDIGTLLDMRGIAVRVGHHCAQPVMQHFGVPATVRASLAFTNTSEELDRLAEGIRKAISMFQ